jgi:hypothetical protein
MPRSGLVALAIRMNPMEFSELTNLQSVTIAGLVASVTRPE